MKNKIILIVLVIIFTGIKGYSSSFNEEPDLSGRLGITFSFDDLLHPLETYTDSIQSGIGLVYIYSPFMLKALVNTTHIDSTKDQFGGSVLAAYRFKKAVIHHIQDK